VVGALLLGQLVGRGLLVALFMGAVLTLAVWYPVQSGFPTGSRY
jgi:hypothetical protein